MPPIPLAAKTPRAIEPRNANTVDKIDVDTFDVDTFYVGMFLRRYGLLSSDRSQPS